MKFKLKEEKIIATKKEIPIPAYKSKNSKKGARNEYN